MEVLTAVRNHLADGRFDANLITVYGIMVTTVIGSIILRRMLLRVGLRLARWTGIHWLDSVGGEASRHARTALFWLTGLGIALTGVAGVAYHMAGRDVRRDVKDWYQHLTLEELLQLGLTAGALGALLLASSLAVRLVRRFRPSVEAGVTRWAGRVGNRESLAHWFALAERYTVVAVRVLASWAGAATVGLGKPAAATLGFGLQILTIVVVARLLTLGCRTLTHLIADLGDRHLRQGQFRRYWDRLTRLFPFGERCFEAAVYVAAASLCVRAMDFIPRVAEVGPRVVECIGILFTSRVLIELLQVLLNEAFGLYDEARVVDQKGRTLVPLLYSICQYVLYFGSAVLMLGVLGMDTKPILAGAGILGLAVGLGAQSLVTDVVSGFFILFENQYLVGDYVQIGEASGTVEAVGIRLTQVRDAQGRLFIIPNGQIKSVVNYSKGYVNAVVDLKLPSGSDLEGVFRAMTEAGRRLRQARKEVVGDTEIQGLVELGTSDMTIRAVTRVQPGAHTAMQNEYRRLLKQTLDHNPISPRPAQAA
jgi:small conductance mechanosensitive channel